MDCKILPLSSHRVVDPEASSGEVRFAAQLGQRFQLLDLGLGPLLTDKQQRNPSESEHNYNLLLQCTLISNTQRYNDDVKQTSALPVKLFLTEVLLLKVC